MSLSCRNLCCVPPCHRANVSGRYYSRSGDGFELVDPNLYSFCLGTSDRKLTDVEGWCLLPPNWAKLADSWGAKAAVWTYDPDLTNFRHLKRSLLTVLWRPSHCRNPPADAQRCCFLISFPPSAEQGLVPKGRIACSPLIWGDYLEHLICVGSLLVRYCN